jgi:hypothetical protein
MIDAQHKAVGVLALLVQLDIAADSHAGGRIAQHRVCDERGLDGRHGEADGHRGKAERDDEGDDVPPQQHRAGRADDRQANRRPQARLTLRREVEHDAGTIGDREPGQQPISAAAHSRTRAGTASSKPGHLAPDAAPDPVRAPPTGQVRAPSRAPVCARLSDLPSSATARPQRAENRLYASGAQRMWRGHM